MNYALLDGVQASCLPILGGQDACEYWAGWKPALQLEREVVALLWCTLLCRTSGLCGCRRCCAALRCYTAALLYAAIRIVCAWTLYLPTIEGVVVFALIFTATDVKRHFYVLAIVVLVELYTVAIYVEYGKLRILSGDFDYEVLRCPVGAAG